MMKRLACISMLALTLALAPAAHAQTTTNSTKTGVAIPITGSGGGSTFAGSFQLQKFATSAGQVVATGTLTGTLTDATGLVTSVVQNVTMPVSIGQHTCDILHLDIGPISLNLLGLQVDLSRIVLDITAQAGSGNLLGNLLCSVAGLLDNPSGLAKLLNDILNLLG